jgi:sterol O-acyltransferase
MFILIVQSYIRTYEASGQPIALAFARMFSRHALALAISDGLVVLSTGFSVIFAKALKNGRIDYYRGGWLIQHTYQTLLLALAVTWTFNR